jgi:hypothetical protein
MTDDMMNLRTLLEKSADADLLREVKPDLEQAGSAYHRALSSLDI